MDIMKTIDAMYDELHGAKHYAKKSLKIKDTNPAMAKHYQEMANDELKHAMYIYEYISKSATEMLKQYPDKDIVLSDVWDEAQSDYAECVAKVRYILSM